MEALSKTQIDLPEKEASQATQALLEFYEIDQAFFTEVGPGSREALMQEVEAGFTRVVTVEDQLVRARRFVEFRDLGNEVVGRVGIRWDEDPEVVAYANLHEDYVDVRPLAEVTELDEPKDYPGLKEGALVARFAVS